MKKILILMITVISSALIFNCAQEPTKFEDNLTNTAPYFTSVPDTVITVGQNFEYTAQVADDTDPANSLAVTVVRKPAWLNYNSTTKTLSGITANTNLDGIGNEVELKVTDGLLSKNQNFKIRANSENDTEIEVNPTSLAFGNVTVSTTSSIQSFTVKGKNLTNDIVITAPSGYQIANNGGPFGSRITLNQSNGIVLLSTINVRFMPTSAVDYNNRISCESVGANSQGIAISGKGVKGVISISTDNMNFGDVTVGNNSESKTFLISGTGLASDITVTAPTGYILTIAKSSKAFRKNKNTLVIPHSNGTIFPTTISTIFAPTLNGTHNSNITCRAIGADDKNIGVNGSGVGQITVNTTNLNFGGVPINTNSPVKSFFLSGVGLSSNINISAPTGYQVSTNSGNEFSNSISVTPVNFEINTNIFVRFKPLNTQNYSGNISCSSNGVSTKNIAVTAFGVDILLINGGTFQMGSTNGENNEQPVHLVTLNTFYINKYEVTQAEWITTMGSNPSYNISSANNPVDNVSWYNILVYCNKRSIQEGFTPCYTINNSTNPDTWGAIPISNNNTTWDAVICNWNSNGYRLPTEAKWEFSARGGNTINDYTYSGSNNVEDVAWYSLNSNGFTHQVGTKNPNGLGIYDMSGNVYEWCWDRFSIYNSSPQTNPTGSITGIDRVCRSGGISSVSNYCRVSSRISYYPHGIDYTNGFRLVRSKLD